MDAGVDSNSIPSISVAAEYWEEIASATSCDRLVEEKKHDKPVSVRTVQHRGGLYTAFATVFGPYAAAFKPRIDAYRLLPASAYDGHTTTVGQLREAVDAGLRERDDHTGLVVSVRGRLMVCAERVRFVLALPTTKPLTKSEAQSYDEIQRRCGWRSAWFPGQEPEWFALERHPVVVYRGHRTLGDDYAVLLWKYRGAIHELFIRDVPLSPIAETPRADSTHPPEDQLSLF
jgi:hypothetical protein